MSRTLKIVLTVISILIIGGFFLYKYLFPSINLEAVPNSVRDRASLSKNLDISNIPTNPQKNLYWGDLHVHTNLSFDAYIGGNRATPSEAYRFAKGETIDVIERKVKIDRPLDFAAVTDHSEFLGELYSIQNEGAPAYNAFIPRLFRSIGLDTVKQRKLFLRSVGSAERERAHMPFFQGFETTKKAWDIVLEAAEKFYDPGKFTTFAAYEWTMNNGGAHLHRNIIFRDMVVPDYPISALEAKDDESILKFLDLISQQGATVLAIPHNTNLSSGNAFVDKTKEYAQLRNKYEPLIEVHQAKGNSEVNAKFWQEDEFANYENYSYTPDYKHDFVRFALKDGLRQKEKYGVNPYKFGLIGSTDTHNSLPGNTDEWSEFVGNHSLLDRDAKARAERLWILEWGSGKKVQEAINPGGLVAVWAEANTRPHIYDALKRREAYATSGGRIQVRFFGGFNFASNYADYETLVKEGYEKGVPMGSDLEATKADQSPSFIIWASKDPEGANLDRIQVIKGWVKNGKLEEKIFNVALSDDRVVASDGSVPSNNATVNRTTGAWDRTKGAVELSTVWTDPEFDPTLNAFYYLRVLENPTARYTLWDEIRYGVKYDANTPRIIQERAWSSPIWYAPN
jgi:hypothetical protein